MSDAYSFDLTEEEKQENLESPALDDERIFERVGLEGVLWVQADTARSAAAGRPSSWSSPRMAKTRDRLRALYMAQRREGRQPDCRGAGGQTSAPMRFERTPGITSVEELHGRFPEVDPTQMVKTVIHVDASGDPDEDLVAVCIHGDLEVNEVKLAAAIGGKFEKAPEQVIEKATGARWASPARSSYRA